MLFLSFGLITKKSYSINITVFIFFTVYQKVGFISLARQMQTTILILIWTAMVITSIVNFAKPAYEQFVGRFGVTINIALSFILWICGAFAVSPYLEINLSIWALILLGLALGTWATIFYDIWKLVQNLGATKLDVSEDTAETKPSALWFNLSPNEEEDAEG